MPKPVEVVTQYYAMPLNYLRDYYVFNVTVEYIIMYTENSLAYNANFVSTLSCEIRREYLIQIQPRQQQPVCNEY
jgi:hypothetical protein